MNDDKKQLCPKCKTGADALKLDPNEPMCPYMEFHSGQTCTKNMCLSKKITANSKQSTDGGVYHIYI